MGDREQFRELSGWSFDVEEVSAGVYRAVGRDRSGRSVELKGTDPDVLLVHCKRAAKECMRTGPWERIKAFQRPSEFDQFVDWIIGQIEAGNAEEIDVERPYGSGGYREKWFRHAASGENWRLVWPGDRCSGLFEPSDDT